MFFEAVVTLPVLAMLVVAVLAADLCGSGQNKTRDYSNKVPESDCLKKTSEGDWNPVEQFLQTGNVTEGELAVNWIEAYLHCLLRTDTEDILSQNNSFLLELRKRELKCTINERNVVKGLCELAKLDISVKICNEEEKNLTARFKSTKGKEEIKSAEELILSLKESLAKHDLILDKIKYIHSLMQLCMRYTSESSWLCELISEQEWNDRMRKKRDTLKDYQYVIEELENERFFGRYVNPVVYGVILLVGLLGNGTLLLIFALVKNVRTKSSVTIFNLVIGDTLNLLINIPLLYVCHYSAIRGLLTGFWCHLFAMTRFVFFAGSALSVVSLSIQRYVITVHALWRPRILGNVFVYLVTVWMLAILVSLPEAFTVSDLNGKCSSFSPLLQKVVSLLNFLFYCVTCPCLMAVFSVLTARHLHKSTRDVPSQLCNTNREQSRNRSARVLRALALAFFVSYVPSFTFIFVHFWFDDELPDIVFRSIDNVTYDLLFLNVCFNPVALYIVSSTFRKPLIMYIFRCSKAKRIRQRPEQLP